MRKILIAFRASQEMRDLIWAEAEKRHVTPSALIRIIIWAYFDL